MKICSKCKEEKCESEFHKARRSKDGLFSSCKECFNTMSKLNRRLSRRKKYPNRIERRKDDSILGNGLNTIYISNGLKAIVDIEDYNELSKYKWNYNGRYATRHLGKSSCTGTIMHRVIMNCPEDKVIDHINGNGLDNRKCNLRVCSYSENSMHKTKLNSNNTSGHIGVSYSKKDNRWIAYIKIDGKRKGLGYFKDIESAIEAREKEETILFKQYRSTI